MQVGKEEKVELKDLALKIFKAEDGETIKKLLEPIDMVEYLKIIDLIETIKPTERENISTTNIIESIKETDAYYALIFLYKIAGHKIDHSSKDFKRKYGPFVPKLMWHFKEHYEIPYEAWNKKDPKVKYALGLSLEHLLYLNKEVVWEPDLWLKYRNEMKYASKTDTHSLKHNNEFSKLWGISNDPLKGTGYRSAVPGILVQWWHAKGDERIPNRMILHWYDWDKVPKSLDTVELVSNKSNKFFMDTELP